MTKSVDFFCFLLKFTFVFLFIYDINFTFIPGLTSARVAFFLLVLFSLKISFSKSTLFFLFFLFFLVLISLIQSFFSYDYIQTSRLFFFIIYSLLVPIIMVDKFGELKTFLIIILSVISLQSIILIFSFVSPLFKDVLSGYIVYGGNFTVENIYRAFGLTSSTGASLSVIQSIGVLSSVILLFKYNFSYLKKIIIILLMFICFISVILSGRTGIIISIAAFIYLFLSFNIKKKIVYTTLLFILFVFLDLNSLAEIMLADLPSFSYDYFSEWVLDTIDLKDNSTYGALKAMEIPKLSIDTIIGTGRISNLDGTNSSGNDSGYIQTYYSLGLIYTVAFYLGYLLYLMYQVTENTRNNFWILNIIFLMYLIEIKEPFMFKYSLPFFLNMILLLSNKYKFNKY